ncbi:ATP-binding protein [Streptomyces sp. NPDC002537]
MATVANPQPWTYTLELPRDPRAPGIARATLRTVLVRHGMRELLDTAELLASELVTNAYVHTAGPSSMRLRGTGEETLRVSVWDTSPRVPALFGEAKEEPYGWGREGDNGRGLLLVRLWASAWGSDVADVVPGGKSLWFELTPLESAKRPEPAGKVTPFGCAECVELEAVRKKAAAGADGLKAAVAVLDARRHITYAHLAPAVVR